MNDGLIGLLIYGGLGFGLAYTLTSFFIPICRFFARRFDFIDQPWGEFHKQHKTQTPLLGGIGMFFGWIITIILILSFIAINGSSTSELSTLWTIIIGAIAINILGLIDDKKSLSPLLKLCIQAVICAGVVYSDKLHVHVFWQSWPATWILSILWMLTIINAFNFCDNMDGLAVGLASIAGILFMIIAGIQNQAFVVMLAAINTGMTVAFYQFNYSPASIFMGNTGSYFLGYILAILSILTIFYQKTISPTFTPIFIPLLILAIPIFDMFMVIWIRWCNGKAVYKGDCNHISHRFLSIGFSPKVAVFLVHLLALAIGLSALPLLWLEAGGVVVVLLQSLLLLLFVSVIQYQHYRIKRR